MRPARRPLAALLLTLVLAAPGIAVAAEGQITIGAHITIAPRWLDPGETESAISPFLVLYAIHDALVKPMPGGQMTPSLAESWTASPDGLTYEFVLRAAKFHNGDPVTAEDVKFSFERYRGGAAGLLKSKVKEVRILDPRRVRFVLKEPWPDFMTFYGTTATGAGWIVPKKHVEKVGDEAFKKAPVGAGPYRFVGTTPGIELVLEAFDGYWRKAPAVKRVTIKSIPDETTRAAALKRGDIDIGYLFTGPVAEEIRRTAGFKILGGRSNAVFYLDFLDQWDPKSPWANQRVRLAASTAIDRKAINEAEFLGFAGIGHNIVPRHMEFALPIDPPALDPKKARQLLAEAGYPNGFDGGDLTPNPPYFTQAEAIIGNLSAVGIRLRMRTMERAAWLTAYREKKLKGVLLAAQGAGGNAATRIEGVATKDGLYAYGVLPEVEDLFQRQARELDRKKREELLHQIQRVLSDRVVFAPVWENAPINGIGPRVEEGASGLVTSYPYTAPFEELRLKEKK
jgi:peptide/nickel transport system substrate-binding protein